MSLRPPFFIPNTTRPPPQNYPSGLPISNINQNPRMINNNLACRPPFAENSINQGLTNSNMCQNDQQPTNSRIPFAHHHNNFSRMPNLNSPPVRLPVPPPNQFNLQSVRHRLEHNFNVNTGGRNPIEKNSNFPINSYQSNFPFPPPSTSVSIVPRTINYESFSNNLCSSQTIPQIALPHSFQVCSQNASSTPPNSVTFSESNITSFPGNVKPSATFSENSAGIPVVTSAVINARNLAPLQVQNNFSFNVPPPILKGDTSSYSSNYFLSNSSKKEQELSEFVSKLTFTKEMKKSNITVPEFRSVLKAGFSLLKLLIESKCKLSNLLQAGDEEWNSELQSVANLKKQLSEICSLVSAPVHLNTVIKKLKYIKRKRELKKKTKLNKLSQKIKMKQNREALSQEIDKYLDDIKEKNLKLKREAELKKEADFILLEVRKKIHEAKRTIEKIKAFEKLRNARLSNATQKGLYILSDHNEKFEKKIASLKEAMLKQLADYEAEEKALKVMLETEQEGQLEEEAQWKLKKVKSRQQIRKNHLRECLFGIAEDPEPSNPLYLFHKHHTSANDSIENLVQIRGQWDIHLAEDGETVPQQWIVPVVPSNSSWEKHLVTPVTSKS